MRITLLISRWILGLNYLVFGLDYFFRFIPYTPSHTGAAQSLIDGLMGTGYIYPMKNGIEIICGLLFLLNRFAPFAAVVVFPISLNVFLFHTVLVPSGWYMGVILLVPNLLLGWGYRKYYAGMFTEKP
jgi:putative oxidoreductase